MCFGLTVQMSSLWTERRRMLELRKKDLLLEVQLSAVRERRRNYEQFQCLTSAQSQSISLGSTFHSGVVRCQIQGAGAFGFFWQNTGLPIGTPRTLYFCWMTEWQKILSAGSCMKFHLLLLCKWTWSRLNVWMQEDAGEQGRAVTKCVQCLSCCCLLQKRASNQIPPLPGCAWHKFKHFAVCSECQFFVFYLWVLQSWDGASSLQPAWNTPVAPVIFLLGNQGVVMVFVCCSLTALPAFGPWRLFPYSPNG